jgi:hypothetical protein
METKHIRMDQEEVIFAKKEILHSQINTLHLIKKLRNYKILRRKELTLRTKLKQEMGILRSKINLIISTMPREAHEKQTSEVKRVSSIKEKVNSDLQRELDDIKAKLARLG